MAILKKLAVIGGDRRCGVCADLFSDDGSECAVFGLEKYAPEDDGGGGATKCRTLSDALGGCDAVILPLPVTQDGTSVYTPLSDETVPLDALFSLLPGGALLFAGNPDDRFFDALRASGASHEVINYAAHPAFALLGCVPTAEGAAAEAAKITGKTVSGSTVLVTGCGRVGRQLALLLRAMGAAVYVSARKDADLTWIEANALKPLRTAQLADCGVRFDLVCNTVPAPVLNARVLSSFKGKPPILELASKPYGAGFHSFAYGHFGGTPFRKRYAFSKKRKYFAVNRLDMTAYSC